MIFENREQAGKKLARKLLEYKKENPFVLAMPRGGVPIGVEVAEVLHAPLDVVVVRKIGLAGNKEFGIGAVAEGGVKILDHSIEELEVNQEELNEVIALEEEELRRRVKIYRDNKNLPDLTDKTAILVDDGIATGMTAKAAIESVNRLNPQKLLLATPVCALDTMKSLRPLVDDFVYLEAPAEFTAVATWYKNFDQLSDEEVVRLLKKSRK